MSVLFIIAFALSAWSMLQSREPHHVALLDQIDQPDAYMENILATFINKQGSPSLTIQSPKMTHYPDNDKTYILHPHVTIYRQSPQPWYITSEYAQAFNGTEHILFSNNVIIHHPADTENPNTTMETASLTIFPDKQQARTDHAVTIRQPDTIVHAIGMLANLNDGTIKLLSQAKGDYAPTS